MHFEFDFIRISLYKIKKLSKLKKIIMAKENDSYMATPIILPTHLSMNGKQRPVVSFVISIALQCVGLQLHSHHIRDTVWGVFQPAKCVRASKTYLRIITRLWTAPHLSFPWFHLCYMQYTSLQGYQFFIQTHYYLWHLTQQQVSGHCCQDMRKKNVTELLDCSL